MSERSTRPILTPSRSDATPPRTSSSPTARPRAITRGSKKRQDKFVLVDHSSNGTFVVIGDESNVGLQREELFLRGQGQLALGRPTTDASTTVVEFICE